MNLDSSVANLSLVGPIYQKKLEKLEIKTIKDILYHVPHRYLDFRLVSPINKIQPGETVTIKGKLVSIKNIYTKWGKKIQLGEVEDKTGKINVVWFNQPFLIKNLFEGMEISLAGKVNWFGRKKALISPEYEKGGNTLHTGRLIPIYPETSGLSSKWLRGRINEAYEEFGSEIKEYLPAKILEENDFPSLAKAIRLVHYPASLEEAEKGRKRLAFEELLFFQLINKKRKKDWQEKNSSYPLKIEKKVLDEFISSLPFILTKSQVKAVFEILSDLSSKIPMNRLLEGDVGSGKTVVAAISAFISFVNGFQTVLMAPTQILAQQHYETLSSLFKDQKVRISLITSGFKKKDLGRTDIFIGTHALIHQKVDFDKVALVVIDEQHRFGVEQREHLVKIVKKRITPHILTMTATPIPRTVALTLYGDLDLSTLKELPLGRQKIITWVIPPFKQAKAYPWISQQIQKEGIQAFIVCPLIEESEVETMKTVASVKKKYKELKSLFKKEKLGLLHGRLSAKEKERVLDAFRKGNIDILVTTPVVEVGIDIPNATIMVIEGAERFGLAQLHQLRGRVGRGEKKSYSLLFTESKSLKVLARLKALSKNLSGFDLAELDLKLRGPGEIIGVKQHGYVDLKIASWNDTDLIHLSQKVAGEIKVFPRELEKNCC